MRDLIAGMSATAKILTVGVFAAFAIGGAALAWHSYYGPRFADQQYQQFQHSTEHRGAVLLAIVGDDDNPGPLDRYEIRAYAARASGDKPLVCWYCPRTHRNADGPGHLGVIAWNLDGDQTGLTLGEILAAVLGHERDEHDGSTI